MTSIFRRAGRAGWTLKFTDASGRERMRSFKTREAAKDEAHRLRGVPAPGRTATVAEYALRWLSQIGPSLRPGSLTNYTRDVRRHIIPSLGHRQLRELTSLDVKDLLSAKRAGLSKKTVLNIKATLHACLSEAVADGYLTTNPASLRGRGRAIKLQPTRAERAAKIMAMDAGQVGAFLVSCRAHRPDWWLLFRAMAVTGMRPGEALALQWEDLDLPGRSVLVRRGWTGGRVMPTKSGAERAVDLSGALSRDLESYRAQADAIALQRGAQRVRWLFPGRGESPRSHRRAERAFKAVLDKAGLPGHYTPHCLRHSYASIQLARGASIYYVQRQLGHASIQMTVDHYGRWLPATNPGAADDLDGALSPQCHQPNRRSATSGAMKTVRKA